MRFLIVFFTLFLSTLTAKAGNVCEEHINELEPIANCSQIINGKIESNSLNVIQANIQLSRYKNSHELTFCALGKETYALASKDKGGVVGRGFQNAPIAPTFEADGKHHTTASEDAEQIRVKYAGTFLKPHMSWVYNKKQKTLLRVEKCPEGVNCESEVHYLLQCN